MTLKELVGPIKVKEIIGSLDKDITELTADSRKAAEGYARRYVAMIFL